MCMEIHYFTLQSNMVREGKEEVASAEVSCVPAEDFSPRTNDSIAFSKVKIEVCLFNHFGSLLRCSGLIYWSVLFLNLSLMP